MTAIEPPYYVYEGHPGNMLVLMGGIACDDYCRALDAEGTPVAGLYVAGNQPRRPIRSRVSDDRPGHQPRHRLSLGRFAGQNAATLA